MFPANINFREYLTDQQRNCADRIRKRKTFVGFKLASNKPRLYALTNRPDHFFARQLAQFFGHEVDEKIVELTHQPLIRAENNRTDRFLIIAL